MKKQEVKEIFREMHDKFRTDFNKGYVDCNRMFYDEIGINEWACEAYIENYDEEEAEFSEEYDVFCISFHVVDEEGNGWVWDNEFNYFNTDFEKFFEMVEPLGEVEEEKYFTLTFTNDTAKTFAKEVVDAFIDSYGTHNLKELRNELDKH